MPTQWSLAAIGGILSHLVQARRPRGGQACAAWSLAAQATAILSTAILALPAPAQPIQLGVTPDEAPVVAVRIVDSVQGGCWRDAEATRTHALEALRRRGHQTLDDWSIVAESPPGTYTLVVHAIGGRLEDGLCVAALSLALSRPHPAHAFVGLQGGPLDRGTLSAGRVALGAYFSFSDLDDAIRSAIDAYLGG